MKKIRSCLNRFATNLGHSSLRHVLLGLGLAAGFVPAARGTVVLPWYEPCPASYTNGGAVTEINGVAWPGTALGSQSAAWTLGGSGVGSITNSGGAALTYPGLYSTNGSVGIWMSPAHMTGGRNRGVLFPTITSGTVYASFLLNVQTAPTANRLFAELNWTNGSVAPGNPSGLTAGIFVNSTANLLISKSSSSSPMATNTAPLSAGTHLIVERYTFDPLNPDEVALWVDPPSLGVAEGSVPPPTIAGTSGSDLPSISSFHLHHNNDSQIASSSLFVDEIRVGTTWADVTPTGPPCASASISSNPTDVSLPEGGMAAFTTLAAGTGATLQWQVSTDSGATWNPVTYGLGTNTMTFLIPVVTLAQNNNRYRCHVAVACDNSTANSTAAILTVTNPPATPAGVVVDDQFMIRNRLSGPVNSTNSVWYAEVGTSLNENADPNPFALVGKPADATSVTWLGYFVESNTPPVHLAIGSALKASLTFTCQGVANGTNEGIRMGLFDHFDAGIRVTADGNGVKNSGTAVRGYMYFQNWDNVFSDSEPQTLYARNNMTDAGLMSTVGDYLTLGHSAAGFTNAPGFSNSIPYTIDLYVARVTTNLCSVAMSVRGGGTNYTTALPDTTYGYHRFDCIAWRPNNLQTTASEFDFSEFKVEVLQFPVTRPTVNIAKSGPNVVLTWANPQTYWPFNLQHAATMGGAWTTYTGATSPYTVGTTNQAYFFRLAWP